MRALRYFFLVLFVSVVTLSCQKDESVGLVPETATVVAVKPDSTGNLLATGGELEVRVGDSTYFFDAVKDSIAFINVKVDTNTYFGLTAINRQHTISFGISSPGVARADHSSKVAGAQLLTSGSVYTLDSAGGLKIQKYLLDSVLATGSFSMLMKNKLKTDTVSGQFRLRLK